MPEETKDDATEPEEPVTTLVVAGLGDCTAYTRACAVAEELCDGMGGGYGVETTALLEPDWEVYARDKAVTVRGRCTTHKKSPLVLLRTPAGAEHYVGGLSELEALFSAELGRAPAAADGHADDQATLARFLDMLSASGNQYVYLDARAPRGILRLRFAAATRIVPRRRRRRG